MTNQNSKHATKNSAKVFVLGGTGKTGRRIVRNLKEQGESVRVGSRSAAIPFDWNNEATWDVSLEGIRAVYISYTPDLAMPGAVDSINAFVDKAKRRGVAKLVLLSGRGEAEAQACEQIVLNSGLDATVLDGRNESLANGVQRALGRQPRDFSDFAREAFTEIELTSNR